MKLTQIISEGIKHIEDMPVHDFINALKNIHALEITEKLDGANLSFGLDDHGIFYTSREAKRGQRYYSEDQFPQSEFWAVGFRSAHRALLAVLKTMRKNGLKPGDVVECEILFGELPNTVPYTADINRIVFLKATKGTPDIMRLKQALTGVRAKVAMHHIPFTDDGKKIEIGKTEIHHWLFTDVRKIIVDRSKLTKIIKNRIDKLAIFIEEDSGFWDLKNYQVISIPKNRRVPFVSDEDWFARKNDFLVYRQGVIDRIKISKLDIKDSLINSLVRNTQSQFGPLHENGGFIEGIVLRDPEKKIFETGITKIVDKSLFTEMNKFVWSVRNKISGGPGKRASIVSRMMTEMASSVNHPKLATTWAKRYIRESGDTKEIRLHTLAKDINFQKVQKEWLSVLQKSEKLLERYYKFYQKNKNLIEARAGNFIVKYEDNNNLDVRTLMEFATTFERIRNYKKEVTEAKTSKDLILVIVGDKLDAVS